MKRFLFLAGLERILFLLIGMVFTFVVFTGCSDDDESEGSGSGIVGTWEWKEPEGEYIDRLQFTSNGTFIETEKEYYTSTGKWETEINEAAFVLDNSNLTLYYLDYYGQGKRTITYTVIQLNSKILELEDKDGFSTIYKRIK